MPWHVSINVLCFDRERLRPRMQRYRDGFPREGTCLPPHSRLPGADVPGAFASKLGRGEVKAWARESLIHLPKPRLTRALFNSLLDIDGSTVVRAIVEAQYTPSFRYARLPDLSAIRGLPSRKSSVNTSRQHVRIAPALPRTPFFLDRKLSKETS